MLEVSIKKQGKEEKKEKRKRLTTDERKLIKFRHTNQKPDKDWDLKNKRRICLSLSRELDTKLRLLIKTDSTLRNKSHAVERICWQFFQSKMNEAVMQLEQAEHQLDHWQRKIDQIKRRKEIINEIQS